MYVFYGTVAISVCVVTLLLNQCLLINYLCLHMLTDHYPLFKFNLQIEETDRKPVDNGMEEDQGNGSSKASISREDSDDVIVIDLDSLPDSTDSAIEAKLDEVIPKHKDKKSQHKKDHSGDKGASVSEPVLGKRVPKETPKAAQARLEAMYRQQTIAKKHNKFGKDDLDFKLPDILCEKGSEKSKQMPPLHCATNEKIDVQCSINSTDSSGKNCLKSTAGAASADDIGGPPCLERMDSVDTHKSLDLHIDTSVSCSEVEQEESPKKKRKYEKDSELVASPTDSETGIKIKRKYVSGADAAAPSVDSTQIEANPVNIAADKSASDLNTDLPLKRKYMKRSLSGTNSEGADSQADGHHRLASLDERVRDAKKPKKTAVSSAFVMGQMKFSAPSKEERKLLKQNREQKQIPEKALLLKKTDIKGESIPTVVPPCPAKDVNFSPKSKFASSSNVENVGDSSSTCDLNKLPDLQGKEGPPCLFPEHVSPNFQQLKSPVREKHDLSPTQVNISFLTAKSDKKPNSDLSRHKSGEPTIFSISDNITRKFEADALQKKLDSDAWSSKSMFGQKSDLQGSNITASFHRKEDSSPRFGKLGMSPQPLVRSDTSSTASSTSSSPLKKSDVESVSHSHKKQTQKRGRPSTSFEDIDAFVEKFDLPSLKTKVKHSRHHKRSESGEDDIQHGRQDSSGHYVTNFKKKHSKKRKESSSQIDIESLVGQFDSTLELPANNCDDKGSSSDKESNSESKTPNFAFPATRKQFSPVFHDNPFASEKILGELGIRKKTETISIPKMNSKSCFVKSGAMDRNHICSSAKLFYKSPSSPRKETLSSRESDSSRSSSKSHKVNSTNPELELKSNCVLKSTIGQSTISKGNAVTTNTTVSKSGKTSRPSLGTSKSTSSKSSSIQLKSNSTAKTPSKQSNSSGSTKSTSSFAKSSSSTKNSSPSKSSSSSKSTTATKTSSSTKTSSNSRQSKPSSIKAAKSSTKTTQPCKSSIPSGNKDPHPSVIQSIGKPKCPPPPPPFNAKGKHKESSDESVQKTNDLSPTAKAQAMTYEEFKRTYNPGNFKTSPIKSSEVPLKKRGRKQGLTPRTDASELSSPELSISSRSPEPVQGVGTEVKKNKSPTCNTANMSIKKRFKFSFFEGTKDVENASKPEPSTTIDITNGTVKDKSVP